MGRYLSFIQDMNFVFILLSFHIRSIFVLYRANCTDETNNNVIPSSEVNLN